MGSRYTDDEQLLEDYSRYVRLSNRKRKGEDVEIDAEARAAYNKYHSLFVEHNKEHIRRYRHEWYKKNYQSRR